MKYEVAVQNIFGVTYYGKLYHIVLWYSHVLESGLKVFNGLHQNISVDKTAFMAQQLHTKIRFRRKVQKIYTEKKKVKQKHFKKNKKSHRGQRRSFDRGERTA